MEESTLIRWDANGMPHSTIFRDKYFCTQNGYAECCYVADQGNNLRERFLKLDPNSKGTFTIMETGFGTGLTFCCAWQLWDQFAPKSWTLHFVSIELYPVSTEDLKRALEIWPSLTIYKDMLSAQYKPFNGGIKDFHLHDGRVKLTIVFEDVVVALDKIYKERIAPQGADVWFLNGYSPFANPLMWIPEVYKGMALLSRQGTTLSTFTVATAVRIGLQAEGFIVEKFPGFGTKREVLKGYYEPDQKG